MTKNDSQAEALAAQHCVPCRGGVPPMGAEAIARYLALVPGWQVAGSHHLERTFTFGDFKSALEFTNKVGAVAEEEGHHPDLELSWGRVSVKIYTHKINGLTESDFVLAAKISRL